MQCPSTRQLGKATEQPNMGWSKVTRDLDEPPLSVPHTPVAVVVGWKDAAMESASAVRQSPAETEAGNVTS